MGIVDVFADGYELKKQTTGSLSMFDDGLCEGCPFEATRQAQPPLVLAARQKAATRSAQITCLYGELQITTSPINIRCCSTSIHTKAMLKGLNIPEILLMTAPKKDPKMINNTL